MEAIKTTFAIVLPLINKKIDIPLSLSLSLLRREGGGGVELVELLKGHSFDSRLHV
jgi:hypothetical protein